MIRKPRSDRSSSIAFSLIETVLALALVGSIIVTIVMGIFSSLETMNDASEKSMQARIANDLVGEVLLNDWASIQQYHGVRRFYDGSGLEVDAKATMVAFQAEVTLEDKELSLPNVESKAYEIDNADSEAAIRVVIVKVATDGAGNYDFSEEDAHRTFSTWVTRMDLPE